MNIIQKLESFKNTFERNDSITLRYEDIIQILKLINKPVTTTNEQPNKYNLKEILENQIEEIKDKYGFMQKHFTPLVIDITKDSVTMLFCGIEFILKSDGTYLVIDTTGG